ncbi:MAG: hypothetical protein C4518_14755 [Desulfobacteraceae bacterium]|nr:MAG: hypothetical protein C4518_14755 [Desulfobacteraceae bacterium]
MLPLKIAHRGAMAEAPENTRSAFDRAIDSGVDGIEFDVQITKDGIPVLYHDAFLQKINGTQSVISDFTLGELLGYDFGRWFSETYSNEKILTLEQMLIAYGTRARLFIEIKSPPNEQAKPLYDQLPGLVVELVKNSISKERMDAISILAFDPGMIHAAFLNAPDLKYILNIEDPFSENAPLNMDVKILHGYCLEHTKLDSRFVDDAHDNGKQIFTYSCDTLAEIYRARDFKVDGIMTNDPGGNAWQQFT